MRRIVCVSDLHLDAVTAGVDRFDDVFEVLHKAVDHAIGSEADAFFFLGDLADPHTTRAHRSVRAMAQACAPLLTHRIQPVLLAGNHDVIEDGTGATVLDVLAHVGASPLSPRLSTSPYFDVLYDLKKHQPICKLMTLPFTASCLTYDPGELVRNWAAGKDMAGTQSLPTVVLGHLNLEGIKPGSETTEMPRGRDVFWPIRELTECFPRAILLGGHYHTPQEYNGVTIVGSAVRLRFDEKDNDPGFLVLEL